MRATKRKSAPIDDDDRLTPEQERDLEYSITQGDAGLTYGPFGAKGLSMQTFFKGTRRIRSVTIQVPTVLLTYLRKDAKRFNLTVEELIALIVETHQYKDQDRQLILLAIEAALPQRSANRSRRRGGR